MENYGEKPEKKGGKGGDKFIQKGKGEKEMDGEKDLDRDDFYLDDLDLDKTRTSTALPADDGQGIRKNPQR